MRLFGSLLLLLPLSLTSVYGQSFGGSTFGNSGTRTAPTSDFSSFGATPSAVTTTPSTIYGAPAVGVTPGTFYYYNQPGVGFYRSNSYASGFPAYVRPFAGSGVQFGSLGYRTGYWRSPSGYYYNWMPRVYTPGVTYGATAVTLEQGVARQAVPPLRIAFEDMRQFLSEAKTKGTLDNATYDRLILRVDDLAGKAKLAQDTGGITPSDEQTLRKELDNISLELARNLRP